MSEPNANLLPEAQPDRRQFFVRGFSRALEGLFNAIERRTPLPLSGARSVPQPLPGPRPVLRPPGALAEVEFLRTCYRCGSCVDACPAHAIRPVQGRDEDLSGTPYLEADVAACGACSALPCVHECPSGALAKPR